jgi:hypothetical protein
VGKELLLLSKEIAINKMYVGEVTIHEEPTALAFNSISILYRETEKQRTFPG